VLRKALQENLVSFPAQIPVFEGQSRPDLQRKIVILYFVRGLTVDDIAERYGLGREYYWRDRLLSGWQRAVTSGTAADGANPDRLANSHRKRGDVSAMDPERGEHGRDV
jgi:hypothetical protein